MKSIAGTQQSHRATVRGLGLKRINQVVELVDTPAVRGMINKVNYLVGRGLKHETRSCDSIRSSPPPAPSKTRRRVGRGIGSGLGKTAGRGHKGQKSRARAAFTRSASKAARCRCSAVCRSAASCR